MWGNGFELVVQLDMRKAIGAAGDSGVVCQHIAHFFVGHFRQVAVDLLVKHLLPATTWSDPPGVVVDHIGHDHCTSFAITATLDLKINKRDVLGCPSFL